MTRQESIYQNKRFIGVLHIADWGVTFDPTEQSPLFNRAKLKTWETVEAAKAELRRTLKAEGQQDG